MSDTTHVVWENMLDGGKFSVSVTAPDENPYQGQFTVTVTETGEVIWDEQVTVSFGAPFGPDMADLGYWQSKTIEVADAWLAKQT